MENGWVLAARRGILRVHICIYWFATLPIGPWIPTAGGEVARIHGRSTRENHCGWHFHRSSMQMSIRQVPRFLFHQHRLQGSSLMMARPASTKSLTGAGRMSLTAAHRGALCVPRDRVQPRLHAPRNGSSHKSPIREFTRSMCISLRSEPRQKERSTPSVMRVRTIKLW